MEPYTPHALWPGEEVEPAPGRTTALTFYPATNPTAGGATILVCPGGGYHMLTEEKGRSVAAWLNALGFHAATLRYRLGPHHQHPAMINDAQRAMRLIRANAEAWGVHTDRVGIMGFSAGGHLASSLSVHHDRFASADDDLVDVQSARPNAAVLCYPVIDMAGAAAHTGSRGNLFGPKADPEAVELMSTHRHVTADTPPTFVWHTTDDAVVHVDNAIMYAQACYNVGVKVELHVYESGPHGLGMALDAGSVASWRDLCVSFLRRHLVT
ncbi:MAG: alpha/beta hydrolase [Phycisphaeraceae bacterium]